MSFHEVRFPEHISYGSKGGPKFKTTVLALDSGYEQRNIDWAEAKAEYDVSHGIKSRDEMDELRSFFLARRGRAYGFRFKDWADFTAVGQQIGVGNGVATQFQMIKTYASGGFSYGRPLRKLVSGTLTQVLVNGVPATFTVNNNTGVVTMNSAPANGTIITVPYVEFDVPVRFDTDHLDAEHDFWEHQSWNSIPLVELRS
ncbi:hypothetical protein [Microcystis phage Mwe-JY26]